MNKLLHIAADAAHLLLNALVKFWPLILLFGILGLIALVLMVRWAAHRFGGRQSVSSMHADKVKPTASKSAHNGPPILESLERLSREHYTVFADLYLPRHTGEGTTHLDYVVLSRHGIFVIQVEDVTGEIFGGEDDPTWTRAVFRKMSMMPNPLWRNRFHVQALAHFLGLPEQFFRSIVYLPKGVTFKMPMPPQVLTEGLGSYIVRQKEDVLTAEMLLQTKSVLEIVSRTQDREAARQERRAASKRRQSVKVAAD